MLPTSLSAWHEQLKVKSIPYWHVREWYSRVMISVNRLTHRKALHRKKRVLLYHVSGLSFAGTETFLQLVAKYLPKDRYDVYFMYSDQKMSANGEMDLSSRLQSILEGGVFPIRFEYREIERTLPYTINGMSPHINTIIRDFDIDLMITAGAGHAEFPFSAITSVPIIMINIFGQPNRQKNITHHVCISRAVADKIAFAVPKEKIRVMYIPSELPPPQTHEWGRVLRRELGIPDTALVFGRVGRASDGIFDPIGLKAFARIADRYPDVHYLIVAPPPASRALVEKMQIPRVHFHPGSGVPKDMWSFYGAMDALAHFRLDGESFGLNIAQAMLAGRPILSHRSTIWNAHSEYLTDEFSRIAPVDDDEAYARNMEWLIGEWRSGNFSRLGETARQVGEELVYIKHHIDRFESYVREALGQEKDTV